MQYMHFHNLWSIDTNLNWLQLLWELDHTVKYKETNNDQLAGDSQEQFPVPKEWKWPSRLAQ
jgi:hypothetical protein